jgi:hypothetical protein
MGVQILSYDLIGKLSSSEKLKKILEIVKSGDIVMLEGKLSPEEESELITKALENVSGKFTGIEVANLSSLSSDSFIDKLKNSLLKLIAKNRFGITVIGPSKIIKEIKMDPKKIEIYLK